MKAANYENTIMKQVIDIFPEEGLKFFGIDKKVKEVNLLGTILLYVQ